MCVGKAKPRVNPEDTYLECSIRTNADGEALKVLKTYCATKLLEIMQEDARDPDSGDSGYYSEPLDRFQ